MEICLSKLIKCATQCLVELGLSARTISNYQHSAFHPLERRLKDQEYINSKILLAQEGFFLGQYQDGEISRHTFSWRIRGIRVLTEVHETGTFQTVYYKEEQIFLSRYEYHTLCFLAQYPNWVFSKEQIYEAVWKEGGEHCGTAVTNVISQLRRKLKQETPKAGYIRTVIGRGYRFIS